MSQEGTTTTTGDQESPEAQEAARAAATAIAADAAAPAASTEDKSFSPEYVKGLRDEAAKYRTEKASAENKLKEREDAELDEIGKAKKEAQEARDEAAKDKAELLRTQVAVKKNLPPSVAARLVGDTKEDLEKDADKLLKDLGAAATKSGGFDQGAGRGAAAKGRSDAWIRSAVKSG
jgi:hypothetical protein